MRLDKTQIINYVNAGYEVELFYHDNSSNKIIRIIDNNRCVHVVMKTAESGTCDVVSLMNQHTHAVISEVKALVYYEQLAKKNPDYETEDFKTRVRLGRMFFETMLVKK